MAKVVAATFGVIANGYRVLQSKLVNLVWVQLGSNCKILPCCEAWTNNGICNAFNNLTYDNVLTVAIAFQLALRADAGLDNIRIVCRHLRKYLLNRILFETSSGDFWSWR